MGRVVQVAAICQGNAAELGRALDSDVIVEPVRGPLIPGFRYASEGHLKPAELAIVAPDGSLPMRAISALLLTDHALPTACVSVARTALDSGMLRFHQKISGESLCASTRGKVLTALIADLNLFI